MLGLKFALFDVTDPTNPKFLVDEVFQEGSATSIAEDEHKAFLFLRERNLLVIPISISFGNTGINGVTIFSVTKEAITNVGIINHVLGPNDSFASREVQRSLNI